VTGSATAGSGYESSEAIDWRCFDSRYRLYRLFAQSAETRIFLPVFLSVKQGRSSTHLTDNGLKNTY
jgi:hypothetical protein